MRGAEGARNAPRVGGGCRDGAAAVRSAPRGGRALSRELPALSAATAALMCECSSEERTRGGEVAAAAGEVAAVDDGDRHAAAAARAAVVRSALLAAGSVDTCRNHQHARSLHSLTRVLPARAGGA